MSAAKCTKLDHFALLFAITLLLPPASALAADATAFLVDEAPLTARLEAIDRQWNVTFRAADKLRVVPAKDLAVWGRYHDVAAGPQILLADGSLLRADVLKLDDKSLVLGDATGLGRGLWDESTLPRRAVRAVLWQPPASVLDRDRLLDQLQRDQLVEDRVLLAGGETLGGMLVSAPLDGPFLPPDVKPGQGVFQWSRAGQAEPLAIPAGKVIAVALASVDSPSRGPPASVWLGCREGSLLHASTIEVQGAKLTIKLAGGGELTRALAGRDNPDEKFWDEVTLIQPASPQVVWLSELKTIGYKHIPFLSVDWPYATDRCVTGGRLRSGGGVYLRGLGMHSTSRLAYDVTGYRMFEAELALDESAGNRGSVIYRVMLQDAAGQWASAYGSPTIRGGEKPVPISVDLAGAARMALIVEFADRGDELDYANWLSARLLK